MKLTARGILGGFQILGHQGKGSPQNFRLPGVERAYVDGREQPLVRVHHQRMRTLGSRPGCAGVPVPRPRLHRRLHPRAPKRRIPRRHRTMAFTGSMLEVDVVPTVGTTQNGFFPARRSDSMASRSILHVHPESFSPRRSCGCCPVRCPSVMPAFSTDRVGMLGDVHHQVATAAASARARINHFPRRGNRVQRAHGRGVVNDAEESPEAGRAIA